MNVLAYVIMKKNTLRRHIERGYYKYGLFCSVHPILMILFSTAVILICRYDNLTLALKRSRKQLSFLCYLTKQWKLFLFSWHDYIVQIKVLMFWSMQ